MKELMLLGCQFCCDWSCGSYDPCSEAAETRVSTTAEEWYYHEQNFLLQCYGWWITRLDFLPQGLDVNSVCLRVHEIRSCQLRMDILCLWPSVFRTLQTLGWMQVGKG